MKTNFLIFGTLLALLFIYSGCSQSGYSDLQKMAIDFVDILESGNESQLKKFNSRISPNQTMIDYLSKHEFDYQKIIKKYKSKNERENVNEKRYQTFLTFMQSFHPKSKKGGKLHLKNIEIHTKPKVINEELDISYAVFEITIKQGELHSVHNFGELLKINGEWKRFY